ncbi:MAG: serine hydrolase [bacterium]|nr:serine hydrolase [bacterium]
MKENAELSQKLKKIAEKLHPQPAELSLAVIDLNSSEIAGVNMERFIYPASIYKIFIAAEILRQVDSSQRKIEDLIEVRDVNEVDKDNPRFFPKSTHRDHRPLLKTGEKVSLDYLLDLMLTRSDNTASNVLMDVAGRDNINNHIILPNGWGGSEVTRKFLDRLKEEKEYRVSKITVSNGGHLAEFFYKVETNQLVNPWVSQKLKEYMVRWRRDGRKGLNLLEFKSYYRKGGWLEINGYKWNIWRGIKSAYQKGVAIIRYNGDAGVVEGTHSHYVIAVLTITKTKWPWVKFPMRKLSLEIYKLMESRRG